MPFPDVLERSPCVAIRKARGRVGDAAFTQGRDPVSRSGAVREVEQRPFVRRQLTTKQYPLRSLSVRRAVPMLEPCHGP
jgi:hypothetical protein